MLLTNELIYFLALLSLKIFFHTKCITAKQFVVGACRWTYIRKCQARSQRHNKNCQWVKKFQRMDNRTTTKTGRQPIKSYLNEQKIGNYVEPWIYIYIAATSIAQNMNVIYKNKKTTHNNINMNTDTMYSSIYELLLP